MVGRLLIAKETRNRSSGKCSSERVSLEGFASFGQFPVDDSVKPNICDSHSRYGRDGSGTGVFYCFKKKISSLKNIMGLIVHVNPAIYSANLNTNSEAHMSVSEDFVTTPRRMTLNNMADPLAQFRRSPESGEAKLATRIRDAIDEQIVSSRPAYRAFAVARGTPRLDLRARELAHAINYSALLDVTYDPSDYTGFMLTFSTGLQAKVDGRNLRPVVDALKANACEFLEEHDGTRFDAPADDAPLIERITLRGRESKD